MQAYRASRKQVLGEDKEQPKILGALLQLFNGYRSLYKGSDVIDDVRETTKQGSQDNNDWITSGVYDNSIDVDPAPGNRCMFAGYFIAAKACQQGSHTSGD